MANLSQAQITISGTINLPEGITHETDIQYLIGILSYDGSGESSASGAVFRDIPAGASQAPFSISGLDDVGDGGYYLIRFEMLFTEARDSLKDTVDGRGGYYNVAGTALLPRDGSRIPHGSPLDNIRLEFLPLKQITGIIQTPGSMPVAEDLHLLLNTVNGSVVTSRRGPFAEVTIKEGESSQQFSLATVLDSVSSEPSVLTYSIRNRDQVFEGNDVDLDQVKQDEFQIQQFSKRAYYGEKDSVFDSKRAQPLSTDLGLITFELLLKETCFPVVTKDKPVIICFW